MNSVSQEAFFDELLKIAINLPSARTMIGAASGAAFGPLGIVGGALLGRHWNKVHKRKQQEKREAAFNEGYQSVKQPAAPTV